ncbi:MAG: RNA methyltransferase [Bacteroidales bacterium]|nr:RNA methyltransferase [Bacteroidales bacterium]
MPELITSPSNPKIKRLLALQQKSSARREAGLFVVEGRRELQHCIDAGFEIDTIFVCPEVEAAQPDARRGWLPWNEGRQTRVFEVSEEVYARMAMREGTEGVVAEVRMPERRLEDLALPENPLVVVLESVEKPGNLGAVLRSADAAGADAVLFCDPLTDLWNPNLIRASVGAVFTVPCVACSSEEAIVFLKARGIRILTAQLQDSSLYYDCDMTVGTALVMGTEATGLSGQWREAADAHIRIPMLGALDSLNVSVSAAILLFEAVRQRRNG